MDAIAVRDLSKRYATRDGNVAALEGISFDIREGDFVAVVGPSGCGKTTLLKILAGLMLKTGIIKQAVTAKELVTNELIDDINHFDAEKIATEARAYRAGG